MKKKLFFIAAILSLGFFASCDDDNEYMLGDSSKVTPSIEIAEENTIVQATNGATVQLKAEIANPSGLKSIDIVSPQLGIDKTIEVNAPTYTLNEEIAIPASTQEGLYMVAITANSKNQLTISKEIKVVVGDVEDTTAPVIELLTDVEQQFKSSVDFRLKVTDNLGLKSIRVWSDDEESVQDLIDLGGVAEYEYSNIFTLSAGYLSETVTIQAEAIDLFGNSVEMEPATFKVKVLPEELYLIGGATEAGWTEADAIPFNKVGEGQFELIATLLSDGYGFKFIGAKDYQHGIWGFEEERAELLPDGYNGTLFQGGGSANITPVEEEGLYKIVVDIDKLTFSINQLNFPEELYLVGGSSVADWNENDAIPFEKLEFGKFRIYSYLTQGGGVKFLPTLGSWADDWGMKPGEEGVLQVEGEANVPVSEDGFYAVEVDFNTMTYQLVKMDFGIMGSFNGWASLELLDFDPVKGNYTFTIEQDFVSAGEFKFKWDGDEWAYNFGAPTDAGELSGEAVFGGKNIKIPEGGTYAIELNLDPSGYTYSVTKK